MGLAFAPAETQSAKIVHREHFMKVLVIEDDPSISAFLEKGLREAGFAVDVAANGVGGEQLARNGAYDVVLLDLMLPQKSGLSVLRSLRDRGQHVPVICLTAKDTVHDRVAGLEAGARTTISSNHSQSRNFWRAFVLSYSGACLSRIPHSAFAI